MLCSFSSRVFREYLWDPSGRGEGRGALGSVAAITNDHKLCGFKQQNSIP